MKKGLAPLIRDQIEVRDFKTSLCIDYQYFVISYRSKIIDFDDFKLIISLSGLRIM